MNSFKHLLIFDLSKLGAAYQLINSYVDNDVVNVFEVSPLGTAAVLILASNDVMALQLIQKEGSSFFKNDILETALIENVNDTVLQTYLSQNVPNIKKHMAIFEDTTFSAAFKLANLLVASGLELVDFRVVRTNPPNLILTASADAIDKLSAVDISKEKTKVSIIDSVQKPLRSYFEVIK